MRRNLYIVNNIVYIMINKTIDTKDIVKIMNKIRKNNLGLTITGIQKKTKILRCKIRILIAYMLGAGMVKERIVGMSKIYYEEKQ